jgi:hypothetical protein
LKYLKISKTSSSDNIIYSKRSIRGMWHYFDNTYMKPFFIADWPNVKDEHDEISEKIINLFDEHMKRRLKNKELQSIVKNSRDSVEKTEQLLREVNSRKSMNSQEI